MGKSPNQKNISPIDFFQEVFTQHTSEKTYSKGEFLIQEGAIEQNLYWIEKGAVRVFMISDKEEITIRFGYKGSIINSLNSFILQEPSQFYIEALRKTTIKCLPKRFLDEFVSQSLKHLTLYNQLLESLICQQIEREIDILIHSPSERYERVLKRSPQLFQEVPLKYIASYLRMTPETLSRIRKS